MKKVIYGLLVMLCFTACSKGESNPIDHEKVLATGELVCAYKEQRVNIDTMYTSYYQFNYNYF